MNSSASAAIARIWVRIPDAESMEHLGRQIVRAGQSTGVIYLHGELGAGKTTVARGLVRELGIDAPVKSPTYTLVELYETQARRVVHFDLYRLQDPEELEFLSAREYFTPDHTCLVEWPERGAPYLPPPDLTVNIEYAGTERRVELTAAGPAGARILTTLSAMSPPP